MRSWLMGHLALWARCWIKFKQLPWHAAIFVLRTDNGPEFLGDVFVDWCESNGIPDRLHRTWQAEPERFHRTI